jgi:bifunctional non-homologous end joining protein LigD
MSAIEGLAPMLLIERPLNLSEPGWVYELKFDGYRLLAEFGDGSVKLRTRNGADATRWFPEVADSLASVRGGPHITDGEICVLDDLGRSDFDRLHDRARRRRWYEGADPVTYCAFDLLMLNGDDIMTLPLLERKMLLAQLLQPPAAAVLFVGHFDSGAEQLFKEAVVPLKLEGLVAKRASSPYVPGSRSPDWVKVKRKGAVPPGRFKREPR